MTARPGTALGAALLAHAEARGVSQSALARSLGVSPQRLHLLVTGRSRVPVPALRDAIAAELGISPLAVLALAHGLDPADPARPPDPPDVARVVALARDPRLTAADLLAVEAAIRDRIGRC